MEETSTAPSPPSRSDRNEEDAAQGVHSSPPNAKRRRSASGDDDDTKRQERSSGSGGGRRARRLDADAASRGRRMFGLLTSTLTKANEDHARRSSGEAGRKRAELEARMQQKQRDQSKKIRLDAELSDRLRTQLRRAFDLALEIELTDEAIRLRKAQKRRMASFLVTSSELSAYDGRESRTTSVDRRTLAPEVPVTLAPVGPSHPNRFKRPDGHPVYFLPNTMLTRQDDTLDDQEDRVDAEIDETDEAWSKTRKVMEDRLASLRESIQQTKEEMEKIDGEDIQSTANPPDKSNADGEVEMKREEPVSEDNAADVPMDDGAIQTESEKLPSSSETHHNGASASKSPHEPHI